ncbi:Hypothetical protein (Fragment) [Durusdinium trenchii]|uniref:Uncharacterized protein n=1 Tax=Durusdinium trenchii TaxID=1381693 RepID=A0ABP0NG75_9DINO
MKTSQGGQGCFASGWKACLTHTHMMLLSGLVARNQEVTWIVGTRDSCICGRLMKPNTQGFVQCQLLFVLCTSRSDSPGQAEPKAKKVKVKKEKAKDTEVLRSRSPKERKKQSKAGKAPVESSSSESSSSEELSQDSLYKLIKPYTRVMLVNLVRKADLNGVQGQVIHPSIAVAPCPPGCVLVRLETGREIAVKPRNLQLINSWERGPHSYSQSERLKQVLSHIKQNSETVLASDVNSGSAILGKISSQGGVGHAL